MLQVKNLNIYHKKDLRPLVTDLSFTLNDGDRAAIIGEEGNGKSTLLKLLHNPSLAADYVEYTGEIRKTCSVCGYLPQELDPADREKDVYTFLCEEPAFPETDYRELSAMAGRLGLSVDLLYSDTRMGRLSGGEKIKVQLLRILCMHPGLFLLDEPSNDIDIETLEWLEAFINGCTFPVLYISHDETLLERTANMILHMEQLKRKTESQCSVMRTGYREYVEQRLKGLERQTRLAQEEKAAYEKQQEKFRRIHDKVEYQQAVISRQNPSGARLLKKKMHAVKSMERRFEKQAENMTRRPDTEDAIFFRFAPGEGIPAGKRVLDYELPLLNAGEKELSRNISLLVRGPEKICIIRWPPKRRGENHPPAAHCRTAFMQKRHSCRLYAPELRGTSGYGQHAGGLPVPHLGAASLRMHRQPEPGHGLRTGSAGTGIQANRPFSGKRLCGTGPHQGTDKRRTHQNTYLPRQHEIHGAGDGPPHTGTLRRPEGQAAAAENEHGTPERADPG